MTKVKDICPNCGSHLMIKDGQFGEFLACPRFPECQYTKPLQDEVELYKPPSPYCKKCNHTGLLPFIKNGKVIQHAFIDCECKLSIPEHYDPVRPLPGDFDFPMSDTFRAYTYYYCNQQDPGPKVSPELPEPEVTIKDIPEWSVRQRDAINQLKGEVTHLLNKINEHVDKSKAKRPRKHKLILSNKEGRGGVLLKDTA